MNQYVVYLLSERNASASLETQFLEAAKAWTGTVLCDFGRGSARDIWNWHIMPVAGGVMSCQARLPQRMLAEGKRAPMELVDVPGPEVLEMIEYTPSVQEKIRKPYNPTQRVDYRGFEG